MSCRPELRETVLPGSTECVVVSGGLGFREGHLENRLVSRLGGEEAVLRSQRLKDIIKAPT